MMGDLQERPRVTIRQGTLVGTTQRGAYPGVIEAFLGVPYALPPTGERRFRPPVKVQASTEEVDASQYGYRAPAKQLLVVGPVLEESEDCLTANIFRPQGTTVNAGSKPLPVVIWIHGGAFNRGNAAIYDSAAVIGWSASPFIVVSFGYRIGSFGFLPSKMSAEEGALNLGLKDQILLMEWVQENIGQFGGDRNNVTLIGISAGAHSIGHHLLNYDEGVAPLFHRVIMESGAPTSRAVRNYDAEIHEQQFADFLKEVGCTLDTSTASASQVFTFLRSLPTSTIAAAQTAVFGAYNPSLRWAFQPVIDGEIIRGRPIDAWRNGRWHRVPIMTGFNTNEGSLYVNKAMNTPAEFTDFWKTLLPQLSDEDLATINDLYPDPETVPDGPYGDPAGEDSKAGLGRQYRRIEAAYAHYAYVAPARQTAYFTGTEVPTYLYQWDMKRSHVGGAAHADNLFYEIRDQKICSVSKSQDELSRALHAYITSFICTGDPNSLVIDGQPRPEWVAHAGKAPEQAFKMTFGTGNEELVGGKDNGKPAESVPDSWAAKESDFWWSKVEISQM